jgi:hypothetical protein
VKGEKTTSIIEKALLAEGLRHGERYFLSGRFNKDASVDALRLLISIIVMKA